LYTQPVKITSPTAIYKFRYENKTIVHTCTPNYTLNFDALSYCKSYRSTIVYSLQLFVFEFIADAYCDATNLLLHREA